MDGESILRLSDVLAEFRGWTRTTVSTYATGSGDQLGRLAAGHDITTRRAARIVQWFSDNWPADLSWPADIHRPDPAPDSPAATAATAAEAAPAPSSTTARAVSAELRQLWARRRAEMDRSDWDAAKATAQEIETTARRLRPDGRIASPEALCLVQGLVTIDKDSGEPVARRYIYDEVVRRYRDGVGDGLKPRRGSEVEKMLTALVLAGDVRFASRRPKEAA